MASLRSSFKNLKVSKLEKPPAHMRPLQQIARDEDMAPSTASRMVRELVAAGEWVRKSYPTVDAGGCTFHSIPHYGPKKQ